MDFSLTYFLIRPMCIFHISILISSLCVRMVRHEEIIGVTFMRVYDWNHPMVGSFSFIYNHFIAAKGTVYIDLTLGFRK